MKLVAKLTLVVALTMPGLASAEMYRWVDTAGTIHFTQDVSQVPSEQRAEANVALEVGSTSGSVGSAVGRGAGRSASEVQFEGEGHLMKVMVRINGRLTLPFYLDTGSTELVIPERVAKMLGGEAIYSGQVTLNTPSGRIRVPTVKLRSVGVGGSEVTNLRASVSPSLEIGLLGGSFLNQFRYSIDPVTKTLTLEPRSDQLAQLEY